MTHQRTLFHEPDRLDTELEFYHQFNYNNGHRWPFVYLHGDAEDNNGAIDDICVANKPLSDYIECLHDIPIQENGLYKWKGTMRISCKVHGKPGIVVISTERHENYSLYGGRIALLTDKKAIEHVNDPQAWR